MEVAIGVLSVVLRMRWPRLIATPSAAEADGSGALVVRLKAGRGMGTLMRSSCGWSAESMRGAGRGDDAGRGDGSASEQVDFVEEAGGATGGGDAGYSEDTSFRTLPVSLSAAGSAGDHGEAIPAAADVGTSAMSSATGVCRRAIRGA